MYIYTFCYVYIFNIYIIYLTNLEQPILYLHTHTNSFPISPKVQENLMEQNNTPVLFIMWGRYIGAVAPYYSMIPCRNAMNGRWKSKVFSNHWVGHAHSVARWWFHFFLTFPFEPNDPIFTNSFRYLKWRNTVPKNEAVLGWGFPCISRIHT